MLGYSYSLFLIEFGYDTIWCTGGARGSLCVTFGLDGTVELCKFFVLSFCCHLHFTFYMRLLAFYASPSCDPFISYPKAL